jgi:hypothetical protein
MSKYEPLTQFLGGRKTEEVPMTFAEIEQVLGAKLPESKQYPAWWSNNPSNNVMTKAWLAAGYRTERVDIGGEKLVFRRDGPATKASPASARPSAGLLTRLRDRLGGTVTVAAGVDLAAPTGEPWTAES